MKKLIVTALISLDGYVAGDGGDMSVMPTDDSFSDYNAEVMRTADVLLHGAGTYRGMLGYWPAIEADETQPAVAREISSYNNKKNTHVVVSNSLTKEETGVWADRTEIVGRADARQRIAELKEGDGGNIVTFGSTVVWNDLLLAGLVDELHLMVGAGAIGSGVPAFKQAFGGHAFDGTLTLTEVRQLDGSQNVLLKYAVTS